jgi:glycosyltransferase involved in cell wall biosynthesis
LGFVPEPYLARLYKGAQAFICATEDEDFGITAVEANAYGLPVIALRSGGLVEAIKEGVTGEFFDFPTVAALSARLVNFKDDHYSSEECYNWAAKFSKDRFLKEFREFIEKAWTEFQAKRY